MDVYINTVGLIGVELILVAYFLLQTGKVTAHSQFYLWLNLVGALAVMVSLIRFWNLSSFVIECFWAAISAWGLLKVWRSKV